MIHSKPTNMSGPCCSYTSSGHANFDVTHEIRDAQSLHFRFLKRARNRPDISQLTEFPEPSRCMIEGGLPLRQKRRRKPRHHAMQRVQQRHNSSSRSTSQCDMYVKEGFPESLKCILEHLEYIEVQYQPLSRLWVGGHGKARSWLMCTLIPANVATITTHRVVHVWDSACLPSDAGLVLCSLRVLASSRRGIGK